MFNEHGEFAVTRHGNILLVHVTVAWNAETAKAYKFIINKTIAPINGISWAIIINVEQWELCTPDSDFMMLQLVAQCRSNGLKREAIVNKNIESVKLELFHKHDKKHDSESSPDMFQRRFLKLMQQPSSG